MHLKSFSLKYMHSRYLIRSSFTKVLSGFRNDGRWDNRISISGQMFFKPLYVVPKHYFLSEREDKLQLSKDFFKVVDSNDYDLIETSNCGNSSVQQHGNTTSCTLFVPLDSNVIYLPDNLKRVDAMLNCYNLGILHNGYSRYVPSLSRSVPKDITSDIYLNIAFLPSSMQIESVLYMEDNSQNVEDKERPERATEVQLLAVKDKLCQSFVDFFKRPHNFSVYHKDIEFQNNIKTITTRGIAAYMFQMYLLKYYGHFHYARVKVDILKVTHHTEDCTVRIRWRVNGISRKNLLLSFGKISSKRLDQRIQDHSEWLDGFSVLSVDRNGLVYKHVCDKMIPDEEQLSAKPSSFRSRLLTLLGLTTRHSPVGGVHSVANCTSFRNCSFKSCRKTAHIT